MLSKIVDEDMAIEIAALVFKLSMMKKISQQDAHRLLQDAVTQTSYKDIENVVERSINQSEGAPTKRMSTGTGTYFTMTDKSKTKPHELIPNRLICPNSPSNKTYDLRASKSDTPIKHQAKGISAYDYENECSEDQCKKDRLASFSPSKFIKDLHKMFIPIKNANKTSHLAIKPGHPSENTMTMVLKMFSLSAGAYDRYTNIKHFDPKEAVKLMNIVLDRVCKDISSSGNKGPYEMECLVELNKHICEGKPKYHANKDLFYCNGFDGRPDAVVYDASGSILAVAEFKTAKSQDRQVSQVSFALGQLYFYLKATNAPEGYIVSMLNGVPSFTYCTAKSIEDSWSDRKMSLPERITCQKDFVRQLLKLADEDYSGKSIKALRKVVSIKM